MITHKWRTILGDIPKDWDTVTLRDTLLDHKSGDWGSDHGEVACSILRSTNFTADGRISFDDVATRFLSETSTNKLSLKANDLLLERSGGGTTQPVGRIAFVESDLSGFAFSNFVQRLRIDPSKIDPNFVGWILYELNRSGIVERLQHQTTQMRNLEYRDYLGISLPKPSEKEQEAIAEAIRKSDHALAKAKDELLAAQRLKTALMQQLFTEGIPGRHKTFRQSKWLSMPSPWKIRPLDELADVTSGFTMGRDLSRHKTVTVPYVTVVNVQAGFFNLSNIGTVQIKETELQTGLLRPNDVLMTEGGDRDKLGRGAIWTGQIETCAFQNHIFRIRFRSNEYLPKLFHYLIQSYQAKRYFFSHAKQTNNLCTINSRELKRFPIGIPEPDEQEEIVEVLDSCEDSLDAINKKIESLLRLKKSLLQNLLTGRVRVNMEAPV